MNIVITGGAGFIGSNAADYFSRKGWNVVIIDNLLSGNYDNIKDLVDSKQVKYYEADIRNTDEMEKIFSENSANICINYAALISVAESTENPGLTEDINVRGLLNLLEISGKGSVKTFVHASSAAIYGDSEVLPKKEDMLPEPKSPYAVTKLTGEYFNSYYGSVYGFKAINCRFFNVFGPRQNPESQYAAAVPIFIKRAVDNSDITIFGDGEQVRDFIYVEDLISAIDYLIEDDSPKEGSLTFNLGYGKYISIKDLVKLIVNKTGSGSKVIYDEPRPGDIKLSYASVEKLHSLGWEEKIGFDKGLGNTMEWFQKNK